MDFFVYIVVRAAIAFLNVLPLNARLVLMTGIVRLVTACVPSFRKVSRRNLELAFPQQTRQWREGIIRETQRSIARLVVDFARMHTLDARWVQEHVDCPFLERFKQIKALHPQVGVVLVTGHLGSFELLAHCVARYGFPISFVVRPFKLKRLDAWWRGMREAAGHKAISRVGAFKEIGRDLEQGRDVAILFDQNVTRNHAIFVDWFGKEAATTKIVALAAIRQKAPIVVASMEYLGEDRYRIHACEVDYFELYDDQAMSLDSKIEIITKEIAKRYVEMIRANPKEWFWMHKRWKTRPQEDDPSFYA